MRAALMLLRVRGRRAIIDVCHDAYAAMMLSFMPLTFIGAAMILRRYYYVAIVDA